MRRMFTLLLAAGLLAGGLPLSTAARAQVDDSWPPPPQIGPGNACSQPLVGSNRTFDVGPGRDHTELTTVPWLSLEAGDVVNIYHRLEPYRTKLGLRAQGTPAAPVIINGVTNAACERPTITGEDAVPSDDAVEAQFFNVVYTEGLATIFLYRGPGDPFGYRPTHITIQNLVITGASSANSYARQDGEGSADYLQGAAGVYSVVVEDLTLENNLITGNENGVFVNTKSAEETSHRIIIRNNTIFGNGRIDSYLEHNLYIQARRSLYEGNFIGQLVPGAQGSSLKDRSSGTVVRFNYIEPAARALDLVEIEGGVEPVKNDPLYSTAWVYGNLIETNHSRPGESSSLLIHWGGDNAPEHFRDGTLYFYNNTVVINSTREQYYWFAIFDMNNNDQKVVAHSNVFANMKDAFMYLGRARGEIELQGANWMTTGWGEAGGFEPDVTVTYSGTVLEGADPAFTDGFYPGDGSPVIDQVNPVPIVAPLPALAENLQVDAEFLAPVGSVPRAINASAADLGAFEAEADADSPVRGDVNCDQIADAIDALFILQYDVAVRIDTQTTCPLRSQSQSINVAQADFNQDGFIDVVDALQIAQCDVGVPDVDCPG